MTSLDDDVMMMYNVTHLGGDCLVLGLKTEQRVIKFRPQLSDLGERGRGGGRKRNFERLVTNHL